MDLRYLHLPAGARPAAWEGPTPFKAVVVVEQDVSDSWQAAASRWLVQSGCLYMMAWGRNCSSWDDSVDHANLEVFDWGHVPDDHFVMTTWHENEPLSETFWFAEHVAFHPTQELSATVIVDVSGTSRETELLQAYQAAQHSG